VPRIQQGRADQSVTGSVVVCSRVGARKYDNILQFTGTCKVFLLTTIKTMDDNKKLLLYGQETERLKFRKLEKSDFDDWTALFRVEGVERFFGQPGTLTPEEHTKNWFDRMDIRIENNLGGMNALEDKTTGKIIGQSGLLIQEVDGINELEVSYSILPQYWNKGYGREAARKCRDYAFENNLTDSLISIVHPENIKSQKVAGHNGMQVDKETTFKGMPAYIFRVRREDWLVG